MKLSINENEIKEALLAWAKPRFGKQFNVVELEFRYGSLQEAVFSKKDLPEEQNLPIDTAPPENLPCQTSAEEP